MFIGDRAGWEVAILRKFQEESESPDRGSISGGKSAILVKYADNHHDFTTYSISLSLDYKHTCAVLFTFKVRQLIIVTLTKIVTAGI